MLVRILLIHNFLSRNPVTWLSLIIRVFTCSKWNHVALEITNQNGRKYILESIGAGVIMTDYEKWAKTSKRIVLPLLTTNPELLNLSIATDLIGQPYGFLDLLNVAAYLVKTRWFGNTQPFRGKDRKGFICSELAALAMGLEKPYLVFPGEFEHLPGLIKEPEFST